MANKKKWQSGELVKSNNNKYNGVVIGLIGDKYVDVDLDDGSGIKRFGVNQLKRQASR